MLNKNYTVERVRTEMKQTVDSCSSVIPRPTFVLTLFITQVEESIDQLVEEMSEKRELYENFMSNGRILQNVCITFLLCVTLLGYRFFENPRHCSFISSYSKVLRGIHLRGVS